ncbi:aKG-HExxH-type peptide beta-hydroxylase [Streptomyces gilvus]|uniref:aKG-HExxH-type peptide beta-hydroxylase n=1 Tax=Streptomyces gilvus TaxID=2920937 RepID=UPI001F0F2120|nr:HEXXH motif-containing putative peptide modification protein [Streptomyces sp. CME 23]MCH5673621.1 HEXXH motif-containing putative peptide modification protein [Streptomyces sp. CME 23]
MTAPATLRMTAEDFASLAACRPCPTALRVLRDGQVSRRLLLLKSVADAARDGVPELWAAHGAAAWEQCAVVRRVDVRAFEEVLLHPHVGVWLGRCLRALHGPGPATDASADLARLGGLAAAAGLRAGLRQDVVLAAPGSLLWLPAVGTLRLSGDADEVRLRDGVLEADGQPPVVVGERGDAAARDTAWCPPRHVTAASPAGAPALSVAFEDGDPYRDAHGHPVLPRQTAAQLRVWQMSVAAAWDVVTRLLPERAAACATLWTALVPLLPPRTGKSTSSSAREAYGAIAASFTPDPVRLAETVVHESAHIAFGALADLTHLADPDDRTLQKVGWREDARPVGSVLTGTHAHLALLEFWRRRRRELTGGQARVVSARLHHYGRQVTDALRILQAHPALTPLGERFVAVMVDEAARCGFAVRPPSSARPGDPSHVRVASRPQHLMRRRAASPAAQGAAGRACRTGCGKTSDDTTPGAG